MLDRTTEGRGQQNIDRSSYYSLYMKKKKRSRLSASEIAAICLPLLARDCCRSMRATESILEKKTEN